MKPKTQKEMVDALSPPTPIDRMVQGELQLFVTALDIPSASASVLNRCVRRILVFPHTDTILRTRLEVIRHELGDRHLNRVFTLSIVSSFISAAGVLVSASALAWTVFHGATPQASPTTTALQMHLPQPLQVSLAQPPPTTPASPTQSTGSASSTQSATQLTPQTAQPAQKQVP